MLTNKKVLNNRRWLLPTSIALLLAVLAGCAEPEIQTMPVSLTGTITAPDGVTADKFYVRLYHAWALEGLLRHPVEEIESFETTGAAFSHDFDYPVDTGEGLLVYAWLDTDGDGVLCTPSVRDDIAGLIEVSEFPADAVTVELELTATCAGPDWFYPPVPQ